MQMPASSLRRPATHPRRTMVYRNQFAGSMLRVVTRVQHRLDRSATLMQQRVRAYLIRQRIVRRFLYRHQLYRMQAQFAAQFPEYQNS